jgi:outer membrane protein OmpA-like peptidoglycan-associated protein
MQGVYSQVTNYKRVAEQFYAKGDYYSATQYYERYLGGKTPAHSGYNAYIIQKQGTGLRRRGDLGRIDADLLYRMGECYYRLNDYIHAEQWFKLLLKKDSTTYPQARYFYGVSLRSNGNIDSAVHELDAFTQQFPTQQYAREAKQELENCIFIQQQLTAPGSPIHVERLSAPVNKEGAGANYAGSWMNASTLVFTSTRSEGYTNALYYVPVQKGEYGKVEKLNVAFPRDAQFGTPTFTPDGNKMFYTGWLTNNEGKKISAIYMSERNDDRWSQPTLIDGNMTETNTYSSRQPHVTADGKYLLFASDRADGIGGFDIWYAELDANGRPGQVLNMGPAINTVQDEEAPFYHDASKTLVFASKGRTGMGGFDLFSSTGDFKGSWTVASNLGFPVNSQKDDSYFIGRGKNLLEDALISSDRASLCCYEMFSVRKSYNQIFTGIVMDCETQQPLSGAVVTAKDPKGNQVAEVTTNVGGRYTIKADAGIALQISGRQDEYQNGLIMASPSRTDTVQAEPICLTKKPDPFKGGVNEVTYQIVFELKTEIAAASYPYLDLIASYLKANPTVVLEIDVHTDGIGSVKSNQFLSQGRANACAEYLVKAGVSPQQLIPKGFGECCPIEKETTPDGKDNPAAREKNRRVVFKMIK